MIRLRLLSLFFMLCLSSWLIGQTTVTLGAAKDNTLYEATATQLSNGIGGGMIAGKTNNGLLRRGVVQFDLSTIPAGATITSTKLTLEMIKTPSGAGIRTVSLHKLTADWGEGTSFDGSGGASGSGNGATATTNDATWLNALHPVTTWTTVGGDYSTTVSGSQSVDALGSYDWNTTGMVTDVQNWLDNGNNYGWALIGDESANKTVKTFATHEFATASQQPVLEVTYGMADVVINEIMYNDPTIGTDTLEFIELYNNGTAAADLTGWSFSQGVTYTFPSTTLNAGDYLVVAYSSASMQSVFGITTQEWTGGGLGNSGEDITIIDASGMTIDSVDYDDGAPWATSPDGSGPSLILCDPNSDNNDGANWVASFNSTGVFINASELMASPGAANNCVLPVNTDPYPYKNIGVVNTTDVNGVADSLGSSFELRGVLYSPDYDGNAGYSFSLVDPTGAINGFNFNDVAGYVATQGDSIHVKGDIVQFNGLTELVIDSVFLISQNNWLAPPTTVSSLGENTEMELIRLNAMQLVDPTQWTNSGSGFNVDIMNATDTFAMRIDADIDIFGTAAPMGYFHVIGIGGQFDNSNPYTEGYQILPRSTNDIILVPAITNSLILTGMIDGPSGNPKAVELYVVNNIPDLSIYGVGVANNGGGTDGQEVSLPAVSATAGDFLYIANDTTGFFNFFGIHAQFENSQINFNGDDAVEIFENFVVIDIFGDINVDGSNTPWEYQDTWTYRNCASGPDGTMFQFNNWSVGPINNFDNQTSNATSPVPMLIGTYTDSCPVVPTANDDNATTDVDMAVTIDVLDNDVLPAALTSMSVVMMPSNGAVMVNGLMDITYTPSTGYCGADMFTYEICNAIGCDTATVNVMVTCPASYPYYPVATVHTEDATGVADSVGVTCELRGIVYGVNTRPVGLQFTMIDYSGGINVFNFDPVSNYTVAEGDSIHVFGTIGQFNGLTQINPDSIIVASTGNALAPYQEVTAFDESTEARLIKLIGVTMVDPTQWTNAGSGFNVDLTDGVNTYAMRIDNDVDIFGTTAPGATDVLNVIGLGGQFDNAAPFDGGYQILPRYLADIALTVNTTRKDLSEDIKFFPNPANTNITVQSDIKLEMIRITNVLGQEIIQLNNPIPIAIGTTTINVSKLATGVYTITFLGENAVWSQQLVIQK